MSCFSGQCSLPNFQSMDMLFFVDLAVLLATAVMQVFFLKKNYSIANFPTFPVGLWVILFILIFKLMSLSGYLDEMTCF